MHFGTIIAILQIGTFMALNNKNTSVVESHLTIHIFWGLLQLQARIF